MAGISVPEARLIVIQPWDMSVLKEIERAILASDIGITPNNDGKVIRLNFPELNEERRKELVKEIKKMGEESKVAIRQVRRDGLDEFKKMQKDSVITEDDLKQAEEQIQKFTNAIYKALIWVHENDAETVAKAIQKNFTSSDLEEITTVVARYKSIEAWPDTLTLSEESFDKLQEIVEMAGELTKRAPYDELVTTKYSEKV